MPENDHLSHFLAFARALKRRPRGFIEFDEHKIQAIIAGYDEIQSLRQRLSRENAGRPAKYETDEERRAAATRRQQEYRRRKREN